MGVLSQIRNNSNILEKHGFEYTDRSATYELYNCWETTINLPKCNYCAWIAVDTNSLEVVIYVEYDCGGEITTMRDSLTTSFDNQTAFFKELDMLVTNLLKPYM